MINTFKFTSILFVLGLLLTGCSSSTPDKTTPELKANFEGGPMPESYKQKAKEAQEKAMQAAAAARANPPVPGSGK